MSNSGFAVAEGPAVYGSTQVQQFRTLWAVWNSSTTVRIGYWTPPLSDSAGADLSLMNDSGTWQRPARLSLAFDQDALPVVAFQKTGTTVSVRKFVSAVKTEYTFTGYSPVLFYNGVVVHNTGATDVCCLYLNAAGTELHSRFQRENFGVDYLINALPSGLVLARLQSACHVRINGTNYMQVWGIDDQGRQVILRSEFYEPEIPFVQDKLTNDVSAADGENYSTIVFGTGLDKFTLDVKVEDGSLTSTIVTRGSADKLSTDVKADGGSYVQTVVGSTAPTDKFTTDVKVEDGEYVHTIVQGNNQQDKLTLDVAADSGSYP